MTAVTTMIDCTHASVHSVPAGAPKVALYVTGSESVASTAADRARFHGSVVTIDQSPDGDLFATGQADVFDVENEAGTPLAAAAAAERRQKSVTLVKRRQAAGFDSTIYVNAASRADLRAVLAADSGVRLNKVAYWVANWNLSEAEAADELGNDTVAIQWASPSSNPATLVPGTSTSLIQANVDLSVTLDTWYPPPEPVPAPAPAKARPRTIRKALRRTAVAAKTTSASEPVLTTAGVTSVISALLAALQHGHGLHLSGTEVRWVLDIMVALAGTVTTAATKSTSSASRAVGSITTILGTGATALSTTVLGANPVHVAAILPALMLAAGHLLRQNVSPAAPAAATAPKE